MDGTPTGYVSSITLTRMPQLPAVINNGPDGQREPRHNKGSHYRSDAGSQRGGVAAAW
jgi:hypothetical protein